MINVVALLPLPDRDQLVFLGIVKTLVSIFPSTKQVRLVVHMPVHYHKTRPGKFILLLYCTLNMSKKKMHQTATKLLLAVNSQ